MKVVIQRVSNASVVSNGVLTGSISVGILVLVGFEETDSKEDVEWVAGKICRLRIFNDEDGIMNLSLMDISAEILVVSQFTLHSKTKKGNRPSYIMAAKPEIAIPLYNYFLEYLETLINKPVPAGIFGAKMAVSLENDGPVTIIIDSKNKE